MGSNPYSTGVGDRIEQPVAFDHRHRVRDDAIDCRYCHCTVERSPSAGLAASDLCMSCRAQVLPDSPLLEPVRESVWQDEADRARIRAALERAGGGGAP